MIRRLLALLATTVLGCNASPKAPAPTTIGSRQVVEVARGLEVPWSLAFAPDGRIFVTERPGRVRVIANGRLVPTPLHTFTNVTARSEVGLMGLALHPDFAKNRLLYVSYGTTRGNVIVVDVVRFRETGSALVEPQTILSNLPAAQYHAGCRLKFGPDGKLYVTTGDATEKEIAQNLQNLGGKTLRVNDDGSIPPDNPWPGSPVFSYGHRNAQGMDWDPKTGLQWQTEHGPSGFDGGRGGDEVNVVERGKNYGWPVIHHIETRAGMESPVAEYTPACAPASGAFWRGDFYFGCLRGERLQKLVLDPSRRKVARQQEFFKEMYGRIREVAAGPDGALYFTTSNLDGRGSARDGDDKILKIVP